ncbi:MAG: diacylglycerol kinase family protein, partial [Spirochaetota bacterium]
MVEVFRTHSLGEVRDIVVRFKNEDFSFIGISGGDGTIHQVITLCIEIYGDSPMPPILLLGDGTMNNIAHSIGLKYRGRINLRKFLSGINSGEITVMERSTMYIEGKYCFLFGCGVTSNFLIEAYKGNKGYRKNIKVINSTIREIFKTQIRKQKKALKLLKPLDGDIYCDGVKLSLRHMLFVLAGTVEEVGMGFRPLYLASKSKGRFHIIATDIEPREILLRLATIGTGNGA